MEGETNLGFTQDEENTKLQELNNAVSSETNTQNENEHRIGINEDQTKENAQFCEDIALNSLRRRKEENCNEITPVNENGVGSVQRNSKEISLQSPDSINDVKRQHNKKLRSILNTILLVVLNSCILAYFVVAAVFWKNEGECDLDWCDGFGMLILLLAFTYFGIIYFHVIKKYFGSRIYKNVLKPIGAFWDLLTKKWFIRIPLYSLPLVAAIIYIVLDTLDSSERLISCLGLVVILVLGFVFSKHPRKIKWRPVLWGLGIQFVMGLLTIRWTVGRNIFRCIGDKATVFLGYADEGSKFVYGEELIKNSSFAFQALSVIYFLSFVVQILYYYGAMQFLILKVGWFLQKVMGTTVCESINAPASVFLGMSEAPLLVKPYLKDLTKSEMHALMTGGFATVAGSVLAAYISFGVSAAHLITASVMSAPAALCYAKLFYLCKIRCFYVHTCHRTFLHHQH